MVIVRDAFGVSRQETFQLRRGDLVRRLQNEETT
jgi:hypothetical protein